MTWREAVRLAGPAYSELAFQATFALRQGNIPPFGPGETLARRARRRVTQSKLLVGGILALISLGAWFSLRPMVEAFVAPTLDRGLFIMAIVGAVLLLVVALLWWTGLQMLPTYLSSGALPFLATLPIPEATLRRVAIYLVLRLFDAPALTCLIAIPLAVGAALGSWAAALATVPGVAVAILLAIALALRTGEFFVVRVQGSGSGPAQTAMRWAYLLLWAVPAFAIYGFIAAAPSFLGLLSSIQGSPSQLFGVIGAFPMPFGLLPAWVSGSYDGPALSIPFAVGGVIAYGAAGLYAAVWLGSAGARLATALPSAPPPAPNAPLRLVSRLPSLAIVEKDLRIASRTPGFAFVILLPLLDALALGLLTVFAHPTPSQAFSLAAAAVSTSALLATFFGPALFALEVMGYAYVRALPLTDRSMILGKVTLVILLYLGSAGIVTLFTLARVFSPATFVAFIAAELPAVLAAGLLEFGILFRRAHGRALPVVNLYTGAWWATLVAVPGILVAGIPLAFYQSLRAAGNPGAVAAMAVLSLCELAATVPLVLGVRGRGDP